ncbi:DUF1129 family protein [Falsibacillus pallidus]|uniref:Putative membrane-anchored protein n=1 Tax=Falsibacillus pallidus TaxID=493781 RepID=A0A370G0F1_9BACI|nr:DUF1129 family protein [Falsibacillus pallidus]RDI37228.1 putative membrane-anchored protein [Falsibacillus pallidus]
MKAKQLIEENNRKRSLLTKENEEYYGDMLVYIRLTLSLSEQQSEEVLMEMLDHLLEGQEEGKSAREIFGEDPKRYADEIIENLPKEQKREIFPFLLGIVLNLISWMLMIRGAAILVVSQFKSVEDTVYPITGLIVFAVILATILFDISFIFKMVKKTLFTENIRKKRDTIKVAIYVALSMGLVIAVSQFTPEFGPVIHYSWLASMLTGAILWGIVTILKKRYIGFR